MPVGTHCPQCDYEIGGAPFGHCPECGRKLTLEDIAYDAGPRRTYIRAAPGRIIRIGVVYVLVVAAWMATSAVRTNLTVSQVLISAVALLSGAVCWCAARGWWLIRPRRLRQLHAAVWMRSCWLLFVPWIVPLLASWMFLLYRTEFEPIVRGLVALLGLGAVLSPMIFLFVLDLQLRQWRCDQDIHWVVKLMSVVAATGIVYIGMIVVAATTGVFG